ncbi:uncharacterized protein LOC135400483, partial [Ornithodoros turicata]|uniref:uncharacterized protein LOC135400483 n=1 Tax=Ornithodoros turicata TaxID=34597 RepID=UPI00313A4D24
MARYARLDNVTLRIAATYVPPVSMPVVDANGTVVLKGFAGYMLALLQSGLGFKEFVKSRASPDEKQARVLADRIWVGVVVSILLTSAMFTLLSKKKEDPVKNYVDYLFYLSAMFFWEADTVSSARRRSNRVLLGTWWMAVMFLGLAFTSFMKTSMTVKMETAKMESIEDLARNPNILPVVSKGFAHGLLIKNNKRPEYQTVWNRIVKFGGMLDPTDTFVRKVMEDVLDGKKAIFSTQIMFVYWIQRLYQDEPPQGEFYFG